MSLYESVKQGLIEAADYQQGKILALLKSHMWDNIIEVNRRGNAKTENDKKTFKTFRKLQLFEKIL